MKKQMFMLTQLLIMFFINQSVYAFNLIIGSIQFPQTITKVPTMRVYCGGQIIPYQSCEVEQETKKFTFKIPKTKYQTRFYILVTEVIQFKVANHQNQLPQNTIEYLKLPPGQPYKLYELILMPNKHEETQSPTLQWHIKKQIIAENGKIPDDAIIICYQPEWIETIQAESSFSLPTIVIKKNVLELIGSEKDLLGYSDSLLISSLNSDTMHATMHQQIRQDKSITRIAPPAA